MIPSDEQSPSELAVSGDEEESETSEMLDSPPLAPTTVATLEGQGAEPDLEQYAAVRAAKWLDAAIDSLAGTLTKPTRYAKDRNAAAMNLINLALRRNPGQAAQNTRVFVLDRAEAARTLARRLGLPE